MVIVPLRYWWNNPPCPSCGDTYGSVEDDGSDPEHVSYLCWCGLVGKVRRDDPDLLAVIASLNVAARLANDYPHMAN